MKYGLSVLFVTTDGEHLVSIKNLILESSAVSKVQVDEIKRAYCRSAGLSSFPKNSAILAVAEDEELGVLRPVLRKSDVRSRSGVAVVAVMTRPASCPHGVCTMCPGGLSTNTPQSYTGHEPAARRGLLNAYDPLRQTTSRISQLEKIGHNVDKVDVILMGGTFNHNPVKYQESFIKGVFDGLNGTISSDLPSAHKVNEVAKHRCIGLTVETRPDMCSPKKLNNLIKWGVTRLELGVQTLYDDVYDRINRGHTVKDVQDAFERARNFGFKITAHMMPGLPGNDYSRDIDSAHRLFTDENYIPDEIKIYPLQIIQGTQMYEEFLEGKAQALALDDAVKIIADIKEMTPPFIRIKRILRDIPAHQVQDGPKKGNIRQLAQALLQKENRFCRCIRCREVGHRQFSGQTVDYSNLQLITRSFTASGGKEYFLSFEDPNNDVLFGFLRLRLLPKFVRSELSDSSIIREVHIYGRSMGIGHTPEEPGDFQHKGLGKRLVQRAEEISQDAGYQYINVISGVGVREYYRKLGYRQNGPYMVKDLL